ncbi:MAG: ATPase RavA [Verrucomicrobiota bacterium]|jgi:MoxR-like ATPase
MNDDGTFEKLAGARTRISEQLSKVVVGQSEVVEQVLTALIAGGNCLITGAPGLAKTLLVKTLADIFSLRFQRIQFTPDLMPSDITGMEILSESDGVRSMKFVEGPVFAQMLLADEINRTPPKTQAALLEAMQERQVTVAGKRYELPRPFFVLATQNPLEMEGTYVLPEAQLDRFMFNVVMDYLPEADEVEVIRRTTSSQRAEVEAVFNADDVLAFQKVVRDVPVAEGIIRDAVKLSAASRPNREGSKDWVNRWVGWGAGTRAAQYLVLGGKVRALWDGRPFVTREDILAMALPVLRHRVVVNYKADADGVTSADVVARLVEELF